MRLRIIPLPELSHGIHRTGKALSGVVKASGAQVVVSAMLRSYSSLGTLNRLETRIFGIR